MFGSEPTHILLILLLPMLLAASAFFSGSETALFGLRGHERSALRERNDRTARSVRSLLADPRALLISLLLGNMTINVLYFVITSALLLDMDTQRTGPIIPILAPILALLAVIMLGEVGPKLLAARRSLAWLSVTGVPLLAYHRLIAPIRVPLSIVIIEPLVRLVSPARPPKPLVSAELASLLEISSHQGIISPAERDLLKDVVELSLLKVRDIMLPRVDMPVAPRRIDPQQLRRQLRQQGPARLPIHGASPDEIVGILDVSRFLLDPTTALDDALVPATFVPELATLDQLLEHYRFSHSKIAIAVDEFGQTAGLVTLGDVIRELFGPSRRREHPKPIDAVVMTGLGRWRIPAAVHVHEFAECFGLQITTRRAATLGGFVTQRLGRFGRIGDSITIGACRITVIELEGPRISALEVESGL